MAAAAEVAGYRAAGHSVAGTAERFGISERAVYKACAKSREGVRRTSAAIVGTGGAGGRARAPAAIVGADDVAGPRTYFRCPVVGDLVRVPPGTRRRMWEEERRKSLQAAAASVVSAEASGAGDPPARGLVAEDSEPVQVHADFVASQSGIEPEPVPVCEVDPRPIGLHNRSSLQMRGGRLAVNSSLDWGPLLARLPGPQLAVVVAVLLILVAFYGL